MISHYKYRQQIHFNEKFRRFVKKSETPINSNKRLTPTFMYKYFIVSFNLVHNNVFIIHNKT